MEQNIANRGVIYINPITHEPYSEMDVRWIDYWAGMGFDPASFEFTNCRLMVEFTPELTLYEIAIEEN